MGDWSLESLGLRSLESRDFRALGLAVQDLRICVLGGLNTGKSTRKASSSVRIMYSESHAVSDRGADLQGHQAF